MDRLRQRYNRSAEGTVLNGREEERRFDEADSDTRSEAMAMMGGKDTSPAIEALTALPLESRYVWRVASALKWAFADCETLNVKVDRQTLSVEDRRRLFELLKHRPLQFCLFLSALFGEKQMEVLMISAIKNARVVAGQTGASEST